MSMMGGTALLEELLAEQAAKDAPQELDTEAPSAADTIRTNPVSSDSSAASSVSGAAALAPAMPVGFQRGSLRVPRLVPPPVFNEDSGQGDDFLAPPSPLSRQIAELAREMDDCLGSLEEWEEDKRQHQENLLSELEAQYVADYCFGDVIPEDSFCRADVHLVVSDPPDLISPPPELSFAEVSLGAADEVLARLRDEDEVERHADEARISQLRAEVEDMRRRAEGDSDLPMSPSAAQLSFSERHQHHPGTPHPGLVLDASLSGLDASALGLQAWRDEVDAVLGQQSYEDELLAGTFDSSPRGITRMEGQLAGAHARVRLLEDVVDSAQACAEDELGQLDQLLSECEEMQTRLTNEC